MKKIWIFLLIGILSLNCFGTTMVTQGNTGVGNTYDTVLYITGSSTTFNDDSRGGLANTPAVNGNASWSGLRQFFGNDTIYINGNGSYLRMGTADPSDFQFGTGDFTIDFWINVDTVDSNWHRVGYGSPVGAGDGTIQFYITNGNKLSFRLAWPTGEGGGQDNVEDSANFVADIWTHVAIVRHEGRFDLYKNGVSVANLTSIKSCPVISEWDIGGAAEGNFAWYSNFRIVNGRAMWTRNFTPPNRLHGN